MTTGPSTAMVLEIKYTEPKFGGQSGPGLGEDSARAVKKLTEMCSLKENSLAEEPSRKTIMRRQDENPSGIAVPSVQISTASTQLKVNAYKRQAMVKMVVEQAKP